MKQPSKLRQGLPIACAASLLLVPTLNAATTITANALSVANGNWGDNTTRGASESYTTLIDGINTLVTFTASVGNIWYFNANTDGILGINGPGSDNVGIESSGNANVTSDEVLTITLTPVSATGITYTVASGVLYGGGAIDNTATFGFTNAADTTTYASATLGNAQSSGSLSFSPQVSGMDSVSFTVRQIGNDLTDTNEAGYFTSFSVSAVPEPSAVLLGGLGVLMLLRRRRC